MMRFARMTVVSLLALVLLACGGSGGKSVLAPPDASAPAASAGAAFMALLDTVPDTTANRERVVLNDYEAFRKLAGEGAPKDAAAVADYRRKVFGSDTTIRPSHISGLGQDFDPNLWLAQLGFHPGQVDADMQFGPPPRDVEAVRGRFDASAIDAAIDKDTSPVRPSLTKTTREGATEYIWGEDLQVDPKNRSVLRRLGRGERLSVKGNVLVWAHSTGPLSDAIDASAGKKTSLAQAPDIKALMGELTKQSVYAVVLSNDVITADIMDIKVKDPAALREIRDTVNKDALRPYTMLAISWGRDAEGPFSVLVLQHATPALAQENLTRLKTKIDTGHSVIRETLVYKDAISKYDASANGVFVTAKIRSRFPTLLLDGLDIGDNLLVQQK